MQLAITLTMLPTIPLSTRGHMIICKQEGTGLQQLRGHPCQPQSLSFHSQRGETSDVVSSSENESFEGKISTWGCGKGCPSGRGNAVFCVMG